jgi:hypothetical protein
MKKFAILLTITAFLLIGCGESHSYTGVMKMQNGPEKTEGKVTVTVKKQSENEVLMSIADADR